MDTAMENTRSVLGAIRDAGLVSLGDGAIAARVPGGLVLAWDAESVLAALEGEIPMGKLVIVDVEEIEGLTDEDDLEEEDRDTLRRLGSSASDMCKVGILPSLETIRRSAGGRPILIRVAQWGGVGGNSGGVPGSSGMGGANQYGSAGGDVNFDNPLSRQQFDVSLDSVRRDPKKNGWFQSFEKRLEGDKLLGHQRIEKDGDLIPYTLSFQERVNRKRKEQIRRMIENRERERAAFDSNSVPSIKATPPIERDYRTMEDKLKARRKQEDPDPNAKRPQHGPESEFVHYPRPPMRTAAVTIKRDGNDSIFKPEHEYGDPILDAAPRARVAPMAGKAPSSQGTEAGLDDMGGRGRSYDTISQHYGEPADYSAAHPQQPYFDGSRRMDHLPDMLYDRVQEDRNRFDRDSDAYLNGHPNSSIDDGPLVMDTQRLREQGNEQRLESDPPAPETFDSPRPFEEAGQDFIRHIRDWFGTSPKQQAGTSGNLEQRMDKMHRNRTRTPVEERGVYPDAPWPYAGPDTPGVGIETGLGRLRNAHS